MSDEIKEILQTLGGIASGDWIQMLPKEANRLLDYITNLQQENQKLTQGVALLTNKVIDMTKSKEDYKSRIEKAVEYIEERFTYEKNTGTYYLTHTFDGSNVFELLNILNGDEDE